MRKTLLGWAGKAAKQTVRVSSTRKMLAVFTGIGLAAFPIHIGLSKITRLAADIPRDAMIIEFPENADFDAYLKDRNGGGVIVDFYANWCNPCMEAAPKIAAISKDEHSQGMKTDLLKVNVDNHEPLVERFDVNMIPCLVLLKDGKEVHRISGRQITKENIRELYRLGQTGGKN